MLTGTGASQTRQLLEVRTYSSLRTLFYFVGHLEEEPLPSFEVHVPESVPFISNCKNGQIVSTFSSPSLQSLAKYDQEQPTHATSLILKSLASGLSEANILASAPLLHKVNNLGT